MKKKIIEVNNKKEMDAWTTYSYVTEPSHEIKYLKGVEDTVFFQGSGASRRRVAPYYIPPLKNTDPEVLNLIDEYHASVFKLEEAYKEWDLKRVEMLGKLRVMSGILPKPYEDIAVMMKDITKS
jgi:hypothetical protein